MQIRTMAQCALLSALMCVCAWISIPVPDIAFTLQTFSLFLTLELLGGKKGSIVCLVYLLLGAVGLPVFTGFRGGLGVLLGATGGYILGFPLAALVYWAMTGICGDRFPIRLGAHLLGLLACYTFGTVWFLTVYLKAADTVGLGVVIAKCVLPYILPDIIKLSLAMLVAKRLRRWL